MSKERMYLIIRIVQVWCIK